MNEDVVHTNKSFWDYAFTDLNGTNEFCIVFFGGS